MIRLICTLTIALLISSIATAQNGGIGGVSRRLAEVLGDARVDDKKGVDLGDLAGEIEIAMIDIDPDKVAELNTELEDLQREERDLLSRLEDLGRGLPVIVGPAEFQSYSISDISESALDLAKTELNFQQVEIARLERIEREKGKKDESEREARRKTTLTAALLTTLEEIPNATEAVELSANEKKSEFPLRIARALFLSGDFVGALRKFKQVPAEDMTFQGRYEMLRCMEETDQLDEAEQILTALIADTETQDSFWNQRAKSLKSIIDNSANLRQLVANSSSRTK